MDSTRVYDKTTPSYFPDPLPSPFPSEKGLGSETSTTRHYTYKRQLAILDSQTMDLNTEYTLSDLILTVILVENRHLRDS